MSLARHHAEWLSLLQVSGPFLSLPVLLRVFPQGLDAHDPEHLRALKLAHEEWEAAAASGRIDPGAQRRWVRFVLRETLGLPDDVVVEGQAIPPGLKASVPEHGENLRPDLVVLNPGGADAGPEAGKPRLLVQLWPPEQDLDKAAAHRRWKAAPSTRMADLLRATGTPVGLVTNGERWMLVHAPPGETAGFASWYANLWLDEPITLRAFRSLLGAQRFFAAPPRETLEALYKESAADQAEVTDQLGLQVRRAVEVLILSLDRADQDHGRKLIAGVSESRLYEAALTVMMRLVFLFSAEERGLLLLGDPTYDDHYAVSTLRQQLRDAADEHGEEILERRFDAWSRLLAVFRAVFGGVRHEQLQLPAYGGHLFDPDRFPFLEGRKGGTRWRETPARPLPINNRTVLHLLEALQLLQVKVPGGGPAEARRLSFRALDIEQIGHVYESLLDHTARRAAEPYLSLTGAKGCEPELPLAELEVLKRKGPDSLVKRLVEATGRSEKALRKGIDAAISPEDEGRFLAACGNDAALWARVCPFASLVREDTFGHPAVILPGSVFVTEGTDRRSTGTHYTPRSLTEPIVLHTLEPLVYDGPAEGKPKEEWKLRPARALLDLKVCDLATGSGAFLVQACRYLSERLVEAWEEAGAAHPGTPGITPEGEPSRGEPTELLLPEGDEERLALARRLIAQRCLYGVDKNPLAVEMAKLSLWLLTLARDKPFTFLDHAIRHGDSLLGLKDLDQVRSGGFGAGTDQSAVYLTASLLHHLDSARKLRKEIEAMRVDGLQDVERQEAILEKAQTETVRLRCAADVLLGAELFDGSADERKQRRQELVGRLPTLLGKMDDTKELEALAIEALGGRPAFHWPLEFPEVMVERGGFDAIVGNPPFMGGKKITGNLGTAYREYLVEDIGRGKKGHADLSAYFFLRAGQLVRKLGGFGLIATNTIAQGDTREVGLEQLEALGFSFPRAVSSQKWPGVANLEVAVVQALRGIWGGSFSLDEKPVRGVTAFLTTPGEVAGKPHPLAANSERSFIGTFVLGMGFVLEPEEAERLLSKDSRNRDVLFPYLNGEDLNSRPDQSPSRWVINFFDWPLDRKSSPEGYSGPVAADYPDCLALVEERVKPERTRRKPTGEYVLRKPLPQKWWIYADKRPALYAAVAGMERVLVTARVSPTCAVAFVKQPTVFHDKIVVFPSDKTEDLAIVQSSVHWEWARLYTSTLGAITLNYSPSDCFETFAFPASLKGLSCSGEEYQSQRRDIMLARREGLTATYNRVHNPAETSEDIQRLRSLHVDMDHAVAQAYGWTDLDLGHGFHETKQGLRYTISEPARREVLARLLRLNHERYAGEVKQGLHEKKKPKRAPSTRKAGPLKPAASPSFVQRDFFGGETPISK